MGSDCFSSWSLLIFLLCEAKRLQTRYTPLTYRHAFRIRKKEIALFSLFAMKQRWTEKHLPLCLSGQKTTKALYTIDLPSWLQKLKYKCLEELIMLLYLSSMCTNAYIQMPCLHVIRIRKKENGNELGKRKWKRKWLRKNEKGKTKKVTTLYPYYDLNLRSV